MKQVLVMAILLFSTQAMAEGIPMVDGPSDEQVIQALEFNGKPGVTAQAAILRGEDGSEPTLLITHQKRNDVRYHMIISNDKLGLTVDGMAGTESTLDTNVNGSLLIKQQNDSVGRSRWERTLTVVYRNNKYVVAGFTYAYRDTLSPNTGGSCDYNLLTGRGIRDGKPARLRTGALDLATLVDSEKLYTCSGW